MSLLPADTPGGKGGLQEEKSAIATKKNKLNERSGA